MNNAIIGKIILAGAMAAAAIAPVAASAHTQAWRFQNEQARIAKGVADGQLTLHEYSKEQQRQADLKAGNGKLTSAERAQLKTELNHNSSRIWFTKHNREQQR